MRENNERAIDDVLNQFSVAFGNNSFFKYIFIILSIIYQPFNFFASLPGKNFTANFEI